MSLICGNVFLSFRTKSKTEKGEFFIMSDEQRLAEAKKIMQAFQQQTEAMQGGVNNVLNPPSQTTRATNEFDNQGGDFAEPGDGNMIGQGFDNQGDPNAGPIINTTPPPPVPQPVTQVQPQPVTTPVVPTTPPQQTNTAPPVARPDVCQQCGSLHPPLRPGEKCPNVGVGDTLKDSGVDDAMINKHLVDLRNILMSQITSKGIKDGRKFLQYSVIELTKALEDYNE